MQKQEGSNLRPSVLETDILPTELCSHRWGGGTRTHEAEWRQIYSLLSLPLENTSLKKRRLRDSNPWGVLPPSGFQDQCNRPTLPNLQFAEAEGFALDLWSLCSQRTSEIFRFYTFLLWQASPSSPSEQRVALPLSHTSIGFRVQRYNTPMQPFCVTRNNYHFSLKTCCWQLKPHILFQLVNVRTWQHSANIIFCRISGYRFCKGETLSGYKYSELATIWLQIWNMWKRKVP